MFCRRTPDLSRRHHPENMSHILRTVLFPAAFFLAGLFMAPTTGQAAITGPCPNCHTMHNSQAGAAMATYGGETGPNNFLTRGSCLGCHAQGGASAIVGLGPDQIPQVLHTDTTDLAGGNFAYITGLKGSGASDAKGHNITALTGKDSTLTMAPGLYRPEYHGGLQTTYLTCNGSKSCHGYRVPGSRWYMRETHHNNVDGRCDTASDIASSYRFLNGVKGYESPDWKNTDASNHNEYYGIASPAKLGCGTGESRCHLTPAPVLPPDGTISQFCATCHNNFHTVQSTYSDGGIGPDALSPFLRHPTDLTIPSSDEFTSYTTYDVNTPVARTTVPTAPSATVTPGSDVVMCLSCHMAHGSDYPDMLRWDYSAMVAHNAGAAAGTGCFACHSQKDD